MIGGRRRDCAVRGEPAPRAGRVLDLSIYRIAQEALTNTLKHAGAGSADVIVRYGDDAVEVECTDDGSGATAHSNGATGHGLVGMRERALILGGEIDAGPQPDGRLPRPCPPAAAPAAMTVRILIADDQHLVRSGVPG